MDREGLKTACRFFGGIKAVATRSGVDDGNLSKWLRGQQTLSEAKASMVMQTLGLPDGTPDTSRVHIWHVERVNRINYAPAFALFFPNGAQIARAPWSYSGLEILKTGIVALKENMRANANALYALTDGKTRAIIRMQEALLLQPENIKGSLTWRNGTQDKSFLNLSPHDKLWLSGTPTPGEFDAVWNDTTKPLTTDDVIAAIHDEGITNAEAIRRIRRKD